VARSGRIGGVKPLTLIGYWRNAEEPEYPDPADLVDPNWDPGERSIVADYLDRGSVHWIQLGMSMCRLCGVENGCAEPTDGTYVWPEGLSHYVRDHSVKLPSRIVDHILKKAECPSNSNLDERHFWPDQVDYTWWRGLASEAR
jgi:hypothetical protein